MKKFELIFVLLFLISTSKISAQIVGDSCSLAIPILVNTSCLPDTFSTTGTTNSGSPIPSCGSFAGADIWFQTTVPTTGHLQITISGISGVSPYWAIYSGTCGNLTQLKCIAGQTIFNLNSPTLAGQVIFIRVWRNASTIPGTFSICATEPNTASNDFCSNPIALTVNSTCTLSTFNNIGCTTENASIAPNPPCGLYNGGDVWFTVIVPTSGKLRIEKSDIGNFSSIVAIYSGTCGAFTLLKCNGNNQSFNLNNSSMAGQTIYIRAWNYGNEFNGGSFNLCAWEPNTPANDFCSSAQPLVVGSSCNTTTFTNLGHTAEDVSVAPNPTCGFYQGGDAWYTVLVPASGKLKIEKQNLGGFNAQMAIYSGTCGTMNQIECIGSNASYNLNDIVFANQTLYVRIWNFNNDFNTGSYNLCAWEPNTPNNDFCVNATNLILDTVCNYITYTNVGCTEEGIATEPNPTCGFYQGGDVWFNFVMPTSGHLRIDGNNLSGMNAQFALYAGTCGSMTQIACGSLSSSFNLNDNTFSGQTLYIRVWNFNSKYSGGSFTMCVSEPNIPVNDHCANALPLSVSSTCNMVTFNNVGATAESISVAPNPACNFYQGGDVWFTAIIPASGHLQIKRENISPSNIQFAVYSGTCGAFTQLDCSHGNGTININDLSLANQTVYIRVWQFNTTYGNHFFKLCAWEPSTQTYDSCVNALQVPVGVICTMNNYSTEGCTAEATSVAPVPTCGFYNGEDAWFKFTMPPAGLVIINSSSIAPMSAQFVVYSGTCGAFTQITCAQSQNSFSVNQPALAGQTIYLRVFDSGNPDGTNFSFCITDATCLVDIDSINTTATSCSLVSDGSITINASCTGCVGTLEYSLNNSAFQASNQFLNVSNGTYSVVVRDSGKPTCFENSSYFSVNTQIVASIYFEDLDGDNFGKSAVNETTCGTPSPNYVINPGDCNDNNASIYPGATEIFCNNIDENCNGMLDDSPGEINILGNCNSIANNDLIPSIDNFDGTNFGSVHLNESVSHTFTIENTGSQNLIISNLQITGVNPNLFTLSSISPSDTITPNQSATFDISFSPFSPGIKTATIYITNNDCDENYYNFEIQGEGSVDDFSLLDIKLFIQGYYIGNGLMNTVLLNQGIQTCPNIADSVEVCIQNVSTLAEVASYKTIIYTDGLIHCRFPNLVGNFYIRIKTRNGIEIWSSNPVMINTSPTLYNFNLLPINTFGNNVLELESGVWGIYSGDINQDGTIDIFDFLEWDIDNQNFSSGFYNTDLNGDGNIDIFDFLIWDPNNQNFIGVITP
jgi:hypothetical protein